MFWSNRKLRGNGIGNFKSGWIWFEVQTLVRVHCKDQRGNSRKQWESLYRVNCEEAILVRRGECETPEHDWNLFWIFRIFNSQRWNLRLKVNLENLVSEFSE